MSETTDAPESIVAMSPAQASAEGLTLPVTAVQPTGQTAPQVVVGTVVPEAPGGLVSDLDGVQGGGFTTTWAKTYFLALLRDRNRELATSVRRLDASDERERAALQTLSAERVQAAVHKVELDVLRNQSRTRDFLNTAGGAFLGTGVSSFGGNWPIGVSISMTVAGLVMLVIGWGARPLERTSAK